MRNVVFRIWSANTFRIWGALLTLAATVGCFQATAVQAQTKDSAGSDLHEADAIHETTDEILESPEFRYLHRLETKKQQNADPFENSWLNKLDFSKLAGLGLLGEIVGWILYGLPWLALAGICTLVVILIVQSIRSAGRRGGKSGPTNSGGLEGEAEPEHRPGDFSSDVYIAKAKELAAEGQFAEAIAQLLLGAMSQIERAELIRYRRGLTHRDYLRAVSSKDNSRVAFRSMVRTYEPIGFGRREATREHFSDSMSHYEAGFRAFIQALPS